MAMRSSTAAIASATIMMPMPIGDPPAVPFHGTFGETHLFFSRHL
ncbi:hypothetical protein ACHMW4_15860 [Mesorhizobium sp. UC22_110]